jgi:hypothetical protein
VGPNHGRSRPCHYSVGHDTPPFHCSIIPPSQPDAYCAKRTQFGGCPAARRGVAVNKQSQTRATWGIWGTVSRVLYKQTQFRRVATGLAVQTNPFPSEDRKSQVLAGKRVMVDWTCTGLRRNKANFPPGARGTWPGGRGTRGIVQTRRPQQKSPSWVSTRVSGPISRVGSVEPDFCRTRQTNPIRRDLLRKTKPIAGRNTHHSKRSLIVRNKANSAKPAGGRVAGEPKCAKRTQSAPAQRNRWGVSRPHRGFR